jgi:hypothetical protein
MSPSLVGVGGGVQMGIIVRYSNIFMMIALGVWFEQLVSAASRIFH